MSNLSEEEIIKECEEIIKDLNNHKDKDFIGRLYYKNRPVEDLLQDILNLCNKEKIKNRKLQEELDVCYETETMLRIELNELKKKYRSSISKDKIREKIKELEKEYEEYKDSQEWEIFDETKYAYELLQKLLEERN